MTSKLGPALVLLALNLVAGPSSAVTLSEARAKALDHPLLVAARARMDVARGDRIQSGLWPNPEFSAEFEDVGGPAHSDLRESRYMISQQLDWSGERGARVKAGRFEEQRQEAEYRLVRAEIGAEVTRAYGEAWVAQQQESLAVQAVELSRQTLSAVERQLEAGNVSPIEQSRAAVVKARSEMTLEQARVRRLSAGRSLGSFWGAPVEEPAEAESNVADALADPGLDSLRSWLTLSPLWSSRAAEIEKRSALVKAEARRGLPDLDVGAGMKQAGGNDDRALALEVRLPLPLFDRAQGAGLAARSELEAARSDQATARLQSLQQLETDYANYRAIRTQLERFDREVLQEAGVVQSAIQKGYDAGKFSYLELLDASRTLIEVRGQQLELLGRLYGAAADLERVTGRSLVRE